MTDPVREFRYGLPAHVRAQLHDTQRVAGFITGATRRGWTVPALLTESTRGLAGVANPGGVVTYRLQHCAAHDPPQKPVKQRPEWCGHCDPDTRHTLDDNGYPATSRCPNCHPLRKATA